MQFDSTYRPEERSRSDVDAANGLLLLEFGTNWCGHCRASQPAIRSAVENLDPKHFGGQAEHLKIEDGSGRPLGRSFRVKLWPTLVLMRNGQELGRVVRPGSAEDVKSLLEQAG